MGNIRPWECRNDCWLSSWLQLQISYTYMTLLISFLERKPISVFSKRWNESFVLSCLRPQRSVQYFQSPWESYITQSHTKPSTVTAHCTHLHAGTWESLPLFVCESSSLCVSLLGILTMKPNRPLFCLIVLDVQLMFHPRTKDVPGP